MVEQTILDMCCGSRMFWFDKADKTHWIIFVKG